MAVTTFELSIIYLACGAPFGVFYLLSSRSEKGRPTFVLKLLGNFVFWPQFAVRLLLGSEWLRKLFDSYVLGRVGYDFGDEEKLRRLRKDLERLCVASVGASRIFEFRDDFDRYAGLSVEIGRLGSGDQFAAGEFQSAAGRKATDAVSATWKRRNEIRLHAHRNIARSEFLAHFSESASNADVIRTVLADLMKTIGDDRGIIDSAPTNLADSPAESFETDTASQPRLLDRAA